MKRYRDYKILMPSYDEAMVLMEDVIAGATSIGLKNLDNKRGKGTFDNYSAFIVQLPDLPKARLMLSVYQSDGNWVLSVVNIIPTADSGSSSLDKEAYNRILQYFVETVLEPVNAGKYEIITNEENYTLQELIPRSWDDFKLWIEAFPLSHHPLDEERWMNFVISLYRNDEHLSMGDFEDWLRTEKGWSYEDIDYFSSRLEYGIELLEKYND